MNSTEFLPEEFVWQEDGHLTDVVFTVLSDGEDTSSLLPFEEVLDLSKRSETAIYTIGLRSSDDAAQKAAWAARAFPQDLPSPSPRRRKASRTRSNASAAMISSENP